MTRINPKSILQNIDPSNSDNDNEWTDSDDDSE